MACKPISLVEHLKTQGGFFNYDEGVAVVVDDD